MPEACPYGAAQQLVAGAYLLYNLPPLIIVR
jgi:hypothetical protein